MHNKKDLFLKTESFKDKKFTLLFGGDIYLKDNIEISKEIIDIFNVADYSVLNLEAPILNNKLKFEKYPKSGPNLFQNENVAGVLKRLGVKYIGGANNHIMDFGIEGIKSTSDILSKNDIFYSGFGKNLEQARTPLNLIDSNITILCVGEEEFGVSSEGCPGYYSMYFNEILEQIEDLKNRNKFIVVFAHGGGEEIPLQSTYIVNRYKEFIDSGADLVVGHHPHVPQGYEEYKGKLIFYSLGNFIHSSFSSSVGMLLRIEIKNNAVDNYNIIPIQADHNDIRFYNHQDFFNYIEKVNDILKEKNLFLKIHQEQSVYMYINYYHRYFKDLFGYKEKLKNIVRFLLKRGKLSSELRSELMLLHLLRNRSHLEFIETALKIKTKEGKRLISKQSDKVFLDLIKNIQHIIK